MSQRLLAGDILVLDGAVRGKLSVADHDEVVFWNFSVCGEHLYPLFASQEICLLQSVLDEFKPVKLYPASSALARECHRLLEDVAPQFNLDHRSQLLRVAAAILSAEFRNVHSHRVGFIRVEEHMMQVFEKLSAWELLNLSVGELADRFGCSRRHLNRLFHHHFGVSVATLRMEMRLSKAVSLLRDPDSKIIRVAEECGFNHLGLFNTCFKRRFGTSPGQWRKAAAQAESASTADHDRVRTQGQTGNDFSGSAGIDQDQPTVSSALWTTIKALSAPVSGSMPAGKQSITHLPAQAIGPRSPK